MLHSKSMNDIAAVNGNGSKNVAELIQKTKAKHGLSGNVKKVYFTPELVSKLVLSQCFSIMVLSLRPQVASTSSYPATMELFMARSLSRRWRTLTSKMGDSASRVAQK